MKSHWIDSWITILLISINKYRQEGCNVQGYFAWSLLDNWEWNMGYTVRFGLYYVDYKNNLTRIPKASVQWFKSMLKSEDKHMNQTIYPSYSYNLLYSHIKYDNVHHMSKLKLNEWYKNDDTGRKKLLKTWINKLTEHGFTTFQGWKSVSVIAEI